MKKMTLEEGIVFAEGRLAAIEQEICSSLPQHMRERYIASISHIVSTSSEQLFEEFLARAATSGQQ
jgi:hypothetical protein